MVAVDVSELSHSSQLLGKSIAVLGSTEEDVALSRSLSQLSEVTSKASQLHADQADTDFFVISELIRDYVCVIQSIKVCSLPCWHNLSFLFCSDLNVTFRIHNNFAFLGRLPKVDLIILEGENVRPSVRPSTKSFFDFNEIWCVGRGR